MGCLARRRASVRNLVVTLAALAVVLRSTTVPAAEAAAAPSPPTPSAPQSPLVTPASAAARTPLTLTEAIATALARSPALASFTAELGIREGERVTASLTPNPELTLEQENFAGSGATRAWRAAETTLALEQVLELGDERARRIRAAELARDVGAWEHAATRVEVARATAEAFVHALAATERVAAARERVAIESALRDSIRSALRVGAASTVDERRAAFALAHASAELDRRMREERGARLALAATWGGATEEVSSLHGDLAIPRPPANVESALARVGEFPDVARWESEIAARGALLALEDARAVPDLRVGAGARHLAESDDVAMVASVGVSLPLFDRNQGQIVAARHERERVVAESRAARIAREAEVRSAHERLVTAYARAEALRSTLVPEADSLLEDVREAYRRGLLRLGDVLDAQRAVSDLRLEAIDAHEEFHVAELALPSFLERVTPPSAAPPKGDRP